MAQNKSMTAVELEKKAKETQADAVRIRDKAAKEREKSLRRDIGQAPAPKST